MFRHQGGRSILRGVVCVLALGQAAAPATAKGWNPFSKDDAAVPQTVSSTARPTFDGERPQFGEGKSWSTAASSKPGVFSRVGQGTSRAFSKTKNALTFGKSKPTSTTVSTFPRHAGGYQSKPLSASRNSGGMLKNWLKPSAASRSTGPPATTNEFLSLQRPKF